MRRTSLAAALLAALLPTLSPAFAASPADAARFQAMDVFELEWASDPQISPDGEWIAYVRNYMDVMEDRRTSNIWLIRFDGTEHRALTSGSARNTSPRWSPDGERLLYVSAESGSTQLHLYWIAAGQATRLTQLTEPPSSISWSPDGRWIALSLGVPYEPEALAELPRPPEGAEWADKPRVIERLTYRADGQGYLEPAFIHKFVLPADGGTPRQITSGDFHHRGDASWTPDGTSLIFSANRHPDWELEPQNSEIYDLDLASGEVRALTDRFGPDQSPAVSPDGKRIAYLGYDDRYQGYQVTALYVMNRDGSEPRRVTGALDRDVASPRWSGDGRSIYFLYSDQGNTKLARTDLGGDVTVLAESVGGLSLGRPYAGGQFSLATNGRWAYTESRPSYPADVAAGGANGGPRRLTRLNEDLFGHKELAEVEEIRFASSFDGRPLQGWIAKPPGFDPAQRYPLLLEIHGGPFADYGDRFSAEVQLYAAAGYVVLYMNPRGSTSYGEEFGNLIHHAYPSQDYDDLMSGVDAVVERGYVDPDRLYVTGGSGGGVLTAWIVGHTDRFRAAVSAKPVINWYSFALTADAYNFFYKYWFSAPPWEDPEQYLRRSPLSYVGNVSTPTMLLTGEIDYRTPISESEQFYQALKLRRVDSALVRIPGASHGIARRPSQLIAKVEYILGWFRRYGGP